MPATQADGRLELETPFATLGDWREERRRWRARRAGESWHAWLARRVESKGKPTLTGYIEECFGVRVMATIRAHRWRAGAHGACRALLIRDGLLYEENCPSAALVPYISAPGRYRSCRQNDTYPIVSKMAQIEYKSKTTQIEIESILSATSFVS